MEEKDLEVGSPEYLYHNILHRDSDEEQDYMPSACCIYRVPEYLRKLNPEAYTPQLISFGPLHHGKPNLTNMEEKKTRYERKFQKRITLEKWKELETFVKDNKKAISNCYEEPFKLKSPEFEKIILRDAVFIIEYFTRDYKKDYVDILLHTLRLSFAICRDMILLENQLPYSFLEKLYNIALVDLRFDVPPSFATLCYHFFSNRMTIFRESKLEGLEFKHFADLSRHAFLKRHRVHNAKGKLNNLPRAVKLYESGLKFKPAKNPKSLLDMKFVKRKRLISIFEVDELYIPSFAVGDETEWLFRNLMAIEQCHCPSDTYICNYIAMFDMLIDTKEDVDLLVDKGIINTKLGNHSSTAELFNKLGENIILSESCFFGVAENLKKHYNNRWNRAKATLVSVYFSNPWRGTATVAAIILLLLTLVQTICSVLSVIYAQNL